MENAKLRKELGMVPIDKSGSSAPRGSSRLARALGVVAVSLISFVATPAYSQEVGDDAITAVWTDFGGFWTSSAADAQVGLASYALDLPDTAHNLLAFTWGGTTYSTGVSDTTLSTNNVTFTADQWSALPIDQITYSFACASAGSNYFGTFVGATEGAPDKSSSCYSPAEAASFLTNGPQGLNLGSGLVNIPSGNARDFTVTSVMVGEIADNVPDILLTQMATAGSNAGQVVSLLNSSNNVVGNSVEFSGAEVAAVNPVGYWDANVYRMNATLWHSSGKAMRLWAVELSDFGLTSSNAASVTKVRWQSTSTEADMSFLGYNTTALSVENVAELPGQPTNLTVSGSGPNDAGSSDSVEASLTWTAPASDGGAPITDYLVEYRVDGGSWTTFTRAQSTATSATVTGLTGLSGVDFRVSADNSGYSGPGITGVGSPSEPASLTPWVCEDLDEMDGISGLVLWLRADCLTGVPTSLSDGSSFSTWSDLSGLDHDAIAVNWGTNPTLESDATSLLNGHPVAHFSRAAGSGGNVYSASSTVLEVPGVDIRKSVNPDVSIFVVYEPERSISDDSDNVETLGLWGVDDGDWDRFFLTEYLGSGWGDDGLISLGPTESVATNGGVNTIPDAGADGVPRLMTVIYDGQSTSGGTPPSNASSVYFRDTLVTTFTDSTTWSSALTQLVIGGDGDNNPFRGKIAEFVVFSTALASDLPTVQNYLNQKYDLGLTPVSGQLPDVMLVDPRAQSLNFPTLTLADSTNAMVCFSQVADSIGSSLIGSPTLAVGRSSSTAGVAENTSTNSWRYSGPRASVATQTSSIQISGTGLNPVVASGSKWLRVSATSDTSGQSACSAADVELDEVVEIRAFELNWNKNGQVSF